VNTQQITHEASTEQTAVEPKEVYFELVTLDGAVYRKDQPAPQGTVTSMAGADMNVIVQSYAEVGDWIEVEMSDGYTVSVPETRVDRLVTRSI
jgi:hypothetical protein